VIGSPPRRDEPREPARGGPARPIGDVVPSALRGMGLPSRAQTRRVFDAWARVADPSWRDLAAPISLRQGTLLVGVSSAPLRDELARFRAAALLAALRAALPDDRLIAVRFVAASEGPR